MEKSSGFELTEIQKQIVDSPSKRLLVLSCAGSGKTRVSVSRIERLITDGVEPKSILALTFSNRASQEMKERLSEDQQGKYVSVRTFHSFGYSIICEFYEVLGFTEVPKIVDPAENRDMLTKIIKAKKQDPQVSLKPLEKYVKQTKNFEKVGGEPLFDEMSHQYSTDMRLANKVDLDDLIFQAINLLKNGEIKKRICGRYRYIFVDEYQDTSESQNVLLNLLVERETSLFLVGDDDQAIYEWRGARPDYIRQKAVSAEFDTLCLTENFRSDGEIVRLANRLISHNKKRVAKSIKPHLESHFLPCYHKSRDEAGQAKDVSDEIERLLSSGKFNAGEIAVLYRNNAQKELIEKALKDKGIASQSLDVDAEFQYSHLIKYLKAIVDFNNSKDIGDALNFPDNLFDKFVFEDAIQAYEKQYGVAPSGGPVEQLDQIYQSDVSFDNDEEVRRRYSVIHQLHFASSWSSSEIINYILDDFESQGYDISFPKENSYIKQVFGMAESYEESYGKTAFSTFVDNLLITLGNNDENIKPDGQAINLLTLHRAKGLEWPVVFIIGVQVGVFPNDYWIESEDDLEAERRLFYVGITRAQKLLYLYSFKDALGAPSTSLIVHSGFLSEIPEALKGKPISDVDLAKLPSRKIIVSQASGKLSDSIAQKATNIPKESGFFEVTTNLSLSPETIDRYQKECFALSQAIVVPRSMNVVIIGAIDINKDKMFGIVKANGFGADQIEYYDYQDSKLNTKRYSFNPRVLGIILGPNAHKQIGSDNLLSSLSQPGYPMVVNLISKHISKSSLQNAITKIKLAYQHNVNGSAEERK